MSEGGRERSKEEKGRENVWNENGTKVQSTAPFSQKSPVLPASQTHFPELEIHIIHW